MRASACFAAARAARLIRDNYRRFMPSLRNTPGYSLEWVGFPRIQLFVNADTGAADCAAGALVHRIHPFQRVSDCGSDCNDVRSDSVCVYEHLCVASQ